MQKYLKNDPKFVRVSNSSLKLLIFQLSNVKEVETIKYAFDGQKWDKCPKWDEFLGFSQYHFLVTESLRKV